MAKLKPLDEWGVNNEALSHALFQRFLRVVQGLESPRDRLERTQKYKGLLPYLVLGGLQGFRTCEMIRERTKDPVLEWRDFPWQKGLIVVRNEGMDRCWRLGCGCWVKSTPKLWGRCLSFPGHSSRKGICPGLVSSENRSWRLMFGCWAESTLQPELYAPPCLDPASARGFA
jgi:hypothetical protein